MRRVWIDILNQIRLEGEQENDQRTGSVFRSGWKEIGLQWKNEYIFKLWSRSAHSQEKSELWNPFTHERRISAFSKSFQFYDVLL
jgi:hypothetical protein